MTHSFLDNKLAKQDIINKTRTLLDHYSLSVSTSSSSNVTIAMTSSVLAISFFVAVFTIVSAAPADEKPLDCPANEKYYKCEHEVCYKTCDHLKHPPACASIAADCFKPGCLCTGDDLRNSEGKCVPMAQCDTPKIL